MTDVAKTEIHPDTLKELKDNLPVLQSIADEFDIELLGPIVAQCADELRNKFPGLDDLTLAAFALWQSQKAHSLMHLYGQESWEKETVAAALVALDLSWSIREAA